MPFPGLVRPQAPKTRWLIAVALFTTVATAAISPPAEAHPPGDHRGGYTFAVIGDIPYGATQIAQFPAVVAQINADRDVQLVDHLGDIKNGSSECTDAYFAMIRRDFDQFQRPLVYTPGDNEWTDCHRPNNGGYNPLERLAAVRSVFFDQPGTTLGQDRATVVTQAADGYPENVRYRRARVSFALPHIVGSNDSLAPWTDQTAPTPEQSAEVLGRTAADIALIRDTFADARRRHDRAVAIMTQADMFDPTVGNPAYTDYYAFTPIVRVLADEANRFDGPVYLFNGDSHVYHSDRPLAPGSSWLAFYGVARPADRLQRVTVDGSANNNDYLKVTIRPRGADVLTWDRIPYTTG